MVKDVSGAYEAAALNDDVSLVNPKRRCVGRGEGGADCRQRGHTYRAYRALFISL